jgi:purine-binding chemotaxis protein CheW
MAEEQFVIFRLGDQEYGMPVAAVDEIARPPDHVSRLPRAPAFIDGVMNLRGSVRSDCRPSAAVRGRAEGTW